LFSTRVHVVFAATRDGVGTDGKITGAVAVIQEISGRIGRTTGRGIAANISHYYPNWSSLSVVPLLLMAKTINGADLGAMGDAVELLIGEPSVLYVHSRLNLRVYGSPVPSVAQSWRQRPWGCA
jgi:hypothetical protein